MPRDHGHNDELGITLVFGGMSDRKNTSRKEIAARCRLIVEVYSPGGMKEFCEKYDIDYERFKKMAQGTTQSAKNDLFVDIFEATEVSLDFILAGSIRRAPVEIVDAIREGRLDQIRAELEAKPSGTRKAGRPKKSGRSPS